jgi:hypothetical protein
MAHKLVFTGSFEEPNVAELCFEVYPDGYLYVYQNQEGQYGLEPSKLQSEDIKSLIKFLETQLP